MLSLFRVPLKGLLIRSLSGIMRMASMVILRDYGYGYDF